MAQRRVLRGAAAADEAGAPGPGGLGGARGLFEVGAAGGVGDASALKMCYGALNKGVTALGATVILAAERAGVGAALRGERAFLRLGLATDGLIALRAGFRTSVLASCNEYKFPSNYHSMKDTAENVDYETLTAAVEVCREVIRSS